MSTAPVHLHVAGGVCVASLHGEIDIVCATEIEASVRPAVGSAAALIVDLTAVTFLDSAGVRMLDNLVGAAQRSGCAMRIVAPTGGGARFTLRLCAFRPELLSETMSDAHAATDRGGPSTG